MTFKGFDAGQAHTISIHAQFISEVLPLIDDLAELKLCLFCYYALHQKEGEHRYLRLRDFASNADLMRDVTAQGRNLDEALAKAVRHGFLLRKDVNVNGQSESLYFMNTAKSRALIEALDKGDWQPDFAEDIEILPSRANIFALYEKNLGMLTPTIAEDLKAAEDEYPHEWIVDAIEKAVTNNKRNWRYVKKILETWQRDGRDEVEGVSIEIIKLYRENFDYHVGSVMAEELQAAQANYPQEWIIEAMRLAVTNNIKRWTYVRSVLVHWQQDGREDAPNPVVQYYRENFDYNIGTVMRAELEEAQANFADDWILDAMKIALENNVKRWTYVRVTLERWKQEGRSDVNETAGRPHQRDKQFEGLNWSDFSID